MVRLLNLDHVAIAVQHLDRALADYRRLYRAEPLYREVVDDQGVEEAMLPVGGSYVQLLQPLGPGTPVARFLERRGEGLHHLAFAVPDIDAALAHLEEQDAELIDRQPRRGGAGHRIAFVHPRASNGALIELVELGDG
jgi:methylmalonyl-CoA/ethylmalonyl-CoA epimerase